MIFTTTRITGLLYLGLVVTGIITFLYAKEQLYVSTDTLATATNLVEQSSLARIGIAAELGAVFFQALLALWFFKLFQKVDAFASITLLLFGTINAIIILIASAFWLSAFNLANSAITPLIEQSNNIQLLFDIHNNLWIVGKLFFGMWLIPMGYLVGKGKISRVLSWILIAGGVGYILSLFISILAPTIPNVAIEALTIPATIGEFWLVGYLLTRNFENK
jgi:hypothetical protein